MRFLLLAVAFLGSGCAMLERVDWAKVGREVAITSLAAAATHNEKVADAFERSGLTPADVRDAVDASVAALSGDVEKAVGIGLDAAARRIPQPTPPNPTGPIPGLDWGALSLGGLYVLNQLRKGWKREDPPKPTGT